MTNDLIKNEEPNPFTEFAAETARWRLLKFVDGRYIVGGEEVPVGRKYVACIAEMRRGWSKFVGGRLVDQKIGRVADGFKPPPRETLGDTDAAQWERDGNDVARDPWAEQIYLVLEDEETGEPVVFVTGSKGGMKAVGEVCGIYGRSPEAGLPIISLGVRSYLHKVYRRNIQEPHLKIVGRTGATAEASIPPSLPLTDQQGAQKDKAPPWGNDAPSPDPDDDYRNWEPDDVDLH